jgi:TPR repeat protein
MVLMDGAIREMKTDGDRGCVRAQYELSIVNYRHKNYYESLRWRLRAAAQGHAAALRMMGEMYEYGLGKPRDLKTARDYYARAATQGDLDAAICQSRAR